MCIICIYFMINMNILKICSIIKKSLRQSSWLAIILLLALASYSWTAFAAWQKPVQPSMAGGALTCLALHPADSSKFFVASGNQIFENGKENAWQLLGSVADPKSSIYKLLSFSVLPDQIFALTSNEILMGNSKTRSWQRIYKDSDKTPLSFTVDPRNPNRWFVGTQKGLWESENTGKTWFRSKIFSSSSPVPLLYFDRDRLFLADEHSLYMAFVNNVIGPDVSGESSAEKNAAKTIASFSSQARIVFQIQKTGQEIPIQEDDQDEETLEAVSLYPLRIRDMIRANHGRSLFLATQEGVFESLDEGYHWSPLPQSGLQSLFIYQLAYSEKEGRLFAATEKGVFAYESKRQCWQKLFEGLARDKAQSIAVLNENQLIAITADGFAQYPLEGFQPEGTPMISIYQPPQEILFLFKRLVELEPAARELHKQVIRYANVSNGKIKRWHASSRLAALLPDFSFGKSLDRNASISTYSGKYITGPEDISKGWDADVSWHLGDVIYSSSQTSIDSREKMMVELRNDLLSEATRIYYERRRLQIALIFNPAGSEQEHFENLLRMDELTALLDSLTNGFFSKRLEQIYEGNPELTTLWVFQQKGMDKN